MALAINQSITAVGVNAPASFVATGGVTPYVYSVVPGGPGGSIDPSTGFYKGPLIASSDPKKAYDTILVTDNVGSTATASLLVGTPLVLFCDIIRNGMGLAADQVWLWDQKIFQLTDSRLYIVVSVPACEPFSNINRPDPITGSLNQSQSVNMLAHLQVDIISRGPDARDRKEEVVLALNSVYSEQQQEANSFFVSRLNYKFINLSNLDGAAIPYRYSISLQMQYMVTLVKPAPYFDTFNIPSTTTDGP